MSTAIAADLGTPGAIESNAGDDFHILWACRRSLQLLNPDGGPTLVIVEGLSREDESGATDPDAFLGVDLTEYFGGESLSAAHRIVISQLKYSQRHPDRPWTAARLCESHSSTGTGKSKVSVITRLAQAFDGFYENHDRTAVVERLRIKLVSNRPADQGLVNALAAAQAWLEKNSGAEGIQARQLLAGTEQSHHDAIQRLQSASNLKSVAYCDFLRCLDLSDCNSDGRLWQRLRLIQELGTVAASPTERARDLYELVAAEALPKVGPRGLRREDILAALGCRGIGDLFPAPPSFETISDPIPTTDAAAMVRALHASPSRRLLAHGAGGVGKTIAVLAVPAFWLRGRCLLYDCFGQGTYLDVPGDERHSPRRALLQLCNQLAVLCGSPFLTQPPDSVDDLWRLFRERLAVAAKILEGSGESLLLVVDAADNAIRAAVTPEDSFVGYLWKVPLPDNTYLLMTARSGGRADSLGAPMDTPRIELAGFDPGASALHLRRVLATATDDEATQFHDLTHGNPRVQYHALSAAGDHPDIATVLHQARRKLDEIFQDYVAAALCLRFSSGDASSYLDDLVCFPRPLQLRNLSEILGLREPEVEALCGALHPGLRRTGDLWGFRDENFDTFLRERLSPEQTRAAHARLAQRMADLPDSEFAARHLAEQLFRAGSDRAVIDLALQDDAGIPIRDEVARVQVVRRRLALAVKAAARAERSETLVGLAIRAADAARSDAAILKLIGDYPDLAALHADPQTIAKHYLDAENQGWFGGAQLRCAALFSRDEQHHARAREHFQMAEAWLRRWMAAPKNERARWSISPSEIAAGAEALFRLTGPEAAARWLSGWRPLDAVLRACRWLADAIASDVPVAQQLSLYRSLRPHPLAAIMFLIAFHRRGATPPEALVEEVLLHAERYSRLNRHSFLQERWLFGISRGTILPLKQELICFILGFYAYIKKPLGFHNRLIAQRYKEYP